MSHTLLSTLPSHLHPNLDPNRKAGFLPKDRNWQHEDASEMMFDDMMDQYDMDISKQDVEFIKALIAGDQARCRFVHNRVHTPRTQAHLINFQS